MINYRLILLLLGRLVLLEAFCMLLMVLVSLIYREADLWHLFYSSMVTMLSGGLIVFFFRNASKEMGKRDGFVVVSLAWVVFSLFGSLPFMISGAIPNFTNAFFETMSGFTTTGASILNDVESLSHGMLFWRSMTQWLGGMGIIVLSLAILPVFGFGGIQLFVAEVPGPAPDKLHPRIGGTAKRLWAIYVIFTLMEFGLLLLGGMDAFDSVCHSMTTMATGGYSTRQESIAAWDSPYIQYVIILFMFLSGSNYALIYFALKGSLRRVWQNEEFRVFLVMVLLFTFLFTAILMLTYHGDLETKFRNSLFQVVSIMTTTGFVTYDYLQWTPLLVMLLFMLMFFGGSAGSTSGGIKVIRVWLVVKNSYLEFKRMLHPNAVIPIRYKKRAVPEQITSNIINFVTLYMLVFIVGVLVMSVLGLDLSTAMGSVAASLGNIGPGIGSVGPDFTYAHLPDFGKWFLSFLMMMGRLELFTVLILFSPLFWRK